MATTYVVLEETVGTTVGGADAVWHMVLDTVEATNAEQARRKAAEAMDEADVEKGGEPAPELIPVGTVVQH